MEQIVGAVPFCTVNSSAETIWSKIKHFTLKQVSGFEGDSFYKPHIYINDDGIYIILTT